MTTHIINIPIPRDKDGFVGRTCPKCKKYFKIKPGTGLPTKHCHCPYCDFEGDQDRYLTKDQRKYAESVGKKEAYDKLVEPLLDDFIKSLKSLETKSRNSLIQFKVTGTKSKPHFPIRHYSELELETNITCDNCTLEFAIYGVFSTCPDCKQINAFSVFRKSIEVCQKQFDLFLISTDDKDLIYNNLKLVLTNLVSCFDGLGKELRLRTNLIFPDRPKNLFQNFEELSKVFTEKFGIDPQTEIEGFDFIYHMFQVRHIFEHNMGVVDAEFVKKMPSFKHLEGRKYPLTKEEIEKLIPLLLKLGDKLEVEINKHNT